MTSIEVKKSKSIKQVKSAKAFYKLGITSLRILDNLYIEVYEKECCLS